MRLAVACFLIFLSGWERAYADFVFNLSQATPGAISLGSSAVFNISIRSNSGTVNNLRALDFFIDADDTLLEGDRTAGGFFSSGTSEFFPEGTGRYVLDFSVPRSFQVFSAVAAAGQTITGENTLLATITLDTSRSAAGTYLMSLSQITVLDPNDNPLAFVNSVPLSYTLTAVPEPSSVLLSLGAGSFALARRRWKRLRSDDNSISA